MFTRCPGCHTVHPVNAAILDIATVGGFVLLALATFAIFNMLLSGGAQDMNGTFAVKQADTFGTRIDPIEKTIDRHFSTIPVDKGIAKIAVEMCVEAVIPEQAKWATPLLVL